MEVRQLLGSKWQILSRTKFNINDTKGFIF